MPTEFVAPMLTDIDKLERRLRTSGYLDAKVVVLNEILPLIRALVESFDERFADTENIVASLLEQSESILQPAFAAQIIATIGAGEQVCQAVIAGKPGPELEVFIKTYRELASATIAAVAEITMEPEAGTSGGQEGEEEQAAEAPEYTEEKK